MVALPCGLVAGEYRVAIIIRFQSFQQTLRDSVILLYSSTLSLSLARNVPTLFLKKGKSLLSAQLGQPFQPHMV